MCDFVNAHEELVHISTLGEYRVMMKKVMRVIKEANNTERKRMTTSRQNKREETRMMIQRAKSLISEIKRGRMRKEKMRRNWMRTSEKEATKKLRV